MRDSDEDLPIVLSFDFRIFFNSALIVLDLRYNNISGGTKQAIRAAWKAKESDLQF